MRRIFLPILFIYLSAFLFFKEEIHNFSHHLKETHHVHSLKCFFGGEEETKSGLTETCHFHDYFIQNSLSGVSFFSLKAPLLLSSTYFFPKNLSISENFIFFLPPSRAPPSLS